MKLTFNELDLIKGALYLRKYYTNTGDTNDQLASLISRCDDEMTIVATEKLPVYRKYTDQFVIEKALEIVEQQRDNQEQFFPETLDDDSESEDIDSVAFLNVIVSELNQMIKEMSR